MARSGDAEKPSEWPQFLDSSRQDSFVRRISTNPVNDLSVNKLSGTVFASVSPHLPSHGQALTLISPSTVQARVVDPFFTL